MSSRSVSTKAWIKSVGLKRQLLKCLMLCHVDIQENSREGNATFIFLGIKLGRVKGPGEFNFQAFTERA